MPTDSISVSNGYVAWDNAISWTLGRPPLPTDNVGITDAFDDELLVTISATAEAYTVA